MALGNIDHKQTIQFYIINAVISLLGIGFLSYPFMFIVKSNKLFIMIGLIIAILFAIFTFSVKMLKKHTLKNKIYIDI
jgi:cobalamin biosynthesis protein CobD/CbiB